MAADTYARGSRVSAAAPGRRDGCDSTTPHATRASRTGPRPSATVRPSRRHAAGACHRGGRGLDWSPPRSANRHATPCASVRSSLTPSRCSAQERSCGEATFGGTGAGPQRAEPVVVGSGRAAVERPEFRWVNTILGNIKNALRGTYHAIRPKYAQRYLSEFEYRFNRCFDLPDIIPRLVYVALRTPPMPERLPKACLV